MGTEVSDRKKPGPSPLADAEKRSVQMKVGMKPRGAERFRAACEKAGLSQADGIRQAMAEWTAKIEGQR